MRRAFLVGLLGLAVSPVATADYAQRLQQAEAEIHAATTALEHTPDAADGALVLTEALITRAWLRGEPADWAAADHALARAVASPRTSPRSCTVAARLHLFLHRVDAAAQALTACGGEERLKDERSALQADLAYAQGDLAAAFKAARGLLQRRAVPSALTRMATLHEAAGHPEEAKALLLAAERADHSGDPAQRAWLRLRRGHVALHQGRWEEARAVYLGAASALPGWWRVEEHLAEVEALLGETDAARERYRAVLAGSPQPALMLALAELLLGPEAQDLRNAAREMQRERLQIYPDAVGGHALEVLLAAGEPASSLLPAARARHQAAPSGENALRLAQVLAAAGQIDEACRVVTTTLAVGWAMAELQWWGAHCPGTSVDPERLHHFNPRAAQMYALPATLSAGRSALAPAPP